MNIIRKKKIILRVIIPMLYCNEKSIFAKYLLPRSINLNGIHKTKTLSFIIKKIIDIYFRGYEWNVY